MARKNYLLLINEDEAPIARKELGEALGVSPERLLQAKYLHPDHPGKCFYVCHQLGPEAGYERVAERAAEIIKGTYLVMDVDGKDALQELTNRGYYLSPNPLDRFPLNCMENVVPVPSEEK